MENTAKATQTDERNSYTPDDVATNDALVEVHQILRKRLVTPGAEDIHDELVAALKAIDKAIRVVEDRPRTRKLYPVPEEQSGNHGPGVTDPLFVPRAWLVHGIDPELTEAEFIQKAGGLARFEAYRKCPFVTLVLDSPETPFLVGHVNGTIISVVMASQGHKAWQTMEWSQGARDGA